jgi:Flp pilus assembly pilin Flp
MLNEMMRWPAAFATWVHRRLSGKDDVGASLVEYALLLALIAVVAIGAIAFLGGAVNNTLNHVANVIQTNTP